MTPKLIMYSKIGYKRPSACMCTFILIKPMKKFVQGPHSLPVYVHYFGPYSMYDNNRQILTRLSRQSLLIRQTLAKDPLHKHVKIQMERKQRGCTMKKNPENDDSQTRCFGLKKIQVTTSPHIYIGNSFAEVFLLLLVLKQPIQC